MISDFERNTMFERELVHFFECVKGQTTSMIGSKDGEMSGLAIKQPCIQECPFTTDRTYCYFFV